MITPEVLTVVITASVTLAGTVLTIVYNFLHERAENKRHSRELELEERRAKLEENRLTIELHNQREVRIFEARLASYPDLFEILMPLGRRALPSLTPEKALKIERGLQECIYKKIIHCTSTDSLQAATELRDALILFAEGETTIGQLREKRLTLLNALHKDLGRTGIFLGKQEPLIESDRRLHRSVLQND